MLCEWHNERWRGLTPSHSSQKNREHWNVTSMREKCHTPQPKRIGVSCRSNPTSKIGCIQKATNVKEWCWRFSLNVWNGHLNLPSERESPRKRRLWKKLWWSLWRVLRGWDSKNNSNTSKWICSPWKHSQTATGNWGETWKLMNASCTVTQSSSPSNFSSLQKQATLHRGAFYVAACCNYSVKRVLLS